MTDNKMIRRYKKWLATFSKWNDYAFESEEGWDQFSDYELAEFKNNPNLGFVEHEVEGFRYPIKRFRNAYTPRYAEFASHFAKDFEFTLYAMNKADDVLLILADLDNKDGTGDVDRAVAHLLATYGFTSAYAEPSTHYKGRHVYFLLDTRIQGVTFYAGREDIWQTFEKFSDLISADPVWKETGVTFDGFYGLPTVWHEKNAFGHRRVSQRGNALKLPRVLNGETDMQALEALKPMSLEGLESSLRDLSHSEQLKGVVVFPQKVDVEAKPILSLGTMNGLEKKKQCISRLLIATNGEITLEEIQADYLANWNPTTAGDTRRDERQRLQILRSLFKKMSKSFRPRSDSRKYPFKSGEFLPQVLALVQPEDFEWKRREILSAERLADFISLKIGDAFFSGKGYFGRTARDTSISNSQKMKANGIMSWALTPHTYKRYLDITKRYGLLCEEEPYEKPIIDPASNRKLVKGKARLIGPGHALAAVRDEWLPLYNKSRVSAFTLAIAI